MTTLRARRAKLEARLAELENRLEDITGELDSHNAADWDELAIEREEDEVLEDMGNAGKREIAMIRAALARMDAGEYGYCVDCGVEIAEERLTILPATPFCARCAEKHT